MNNTYRPFESQNRVESREGIIMQAEYNEAEDHECVEFQAQMPERISAGEDLQSFPHMLTCERCRALVRDLEYIVEFARQLIPVEVEPPDEVWVGIRKAIERGDA